jgi:non-ribosomal peptide synthetase component F
MAPACNGESGLAQLFDFQRRTRPSAIAIQTHDERISYVELHARANRLANLLRAAGVVVETRVGILMGKCIESIVAQVAICKAGSTCVPLDPSHSHERIEWMIRDAGISLIITHASTRDIMPDVPRLCVDTDAARIVRGSSICPLPEAGAEARSHIIYTFDAIGRPERVDVLARDIARLVHVSVLDVWRSLMCGDRIVLSAEQGEPHSPS